VSFLEAAGVAKDVRETVFVRYAVTGATYPGLLAYVMLGTPALENT
jgi:hypothetical protein